MTSLAFQFGLKRFLKSSFWKNVPNQITSKILRNRRRRGTSFLQPHHESSSRSKFQLSRSNGVVKFGCSRILFELCRVWISKIMRSDGTFHGQNELMCYRKNSLICKRASSLEIFPFIATAWNGTMLRLEKDLVRWWIHRHGSINNFPKNHTKISLEINFGQNDFLVAVK